MVTGSGEILLHNKKKNLIHIGVLLFLVALTFYLLFRDKDIGSVVASIHGTDPIYIVLSFGLVIVFVCFESVIIHYMMRSLKKKSRLLSCIKYSFIGFFFSCITPSATGGQPAQLYYMKKDGWDLSVSTLILMIVTVGYKFVLVFIGAVILLFHHDFIFDYLGNTVFFFYLGIFLNVVCVLGIVVLIFEPNLARKIAMWGLCVLQKLHILKSKPDREARLLKSMEQYHAAASYFRTHKIVIWNVFLLSLFQRVCLFFVTYLVYRAFGLHGFSPYHMILLQAAISIGVDMLPLPGGIGASESLFTIIFKPIFGASLVLSGMLLSRGISYYGLLLISAVITIAAHLHVLRMDRSSAADR